MKPQTAAVILAAGASSRLGTPKQTARVGAFTLLERAVSVARAAQLDPVVVVLGCGAEAIAAQCDLQGSTVVVNHGWSQGMAGSVAAGIAAVEGSEGAVVMTCDMPALRPGHLQALVAAGAGRLTVGSAYGGRVGVPAYFPAVRFAELTVLQGDRGAQRLLVGQLCLPLQGGEVDVDTPEDLRRAQAAEELA